ncbi:MAG: hypothetical protein HKN20_06375, partial [Gemmatimonadetes bacterium]|nr:hypothetical protein [Gemmatimonadota bacterium]
YLLDIYAASEKPIEGIDSGLLARKIEEAGGPEAVWLEDRASVVSELAKEVKAGDLFLTLGAGDVWHVGEELFVAIAERAKDDHGADG